MLFPKDCYTKVGSFYKFFCTFVAYMCMNSENIIIEDNLHRLGSEEFRHCIAHVLCQAGRYTFEYNGENFVLEAGQTMIIPYQQFIEVVVPSPYLQATCIYLTPEYAEYCTPRSNYGIRGALALFANPIMLLTEKQFAQLQYDFEQIKRRLTDTTHAFQEEVLHSAVQMLILDYFDIHTSLFGQQKITFQDNDLMVRFMALLEQEEYVQHREVGYYADKLFVSAKHLSEVCKQVSGRNALFWINRFTTIHIRKLLQQKTHSITSLTDLFGFSSTAYFSRFVQQHLGVSPSAFYQ